MCDRIALSGNLNKGELYMFFFKKKTDSTDTPDTPLKRKAKAMPMTKKVQFCYIKPDELTALLSGDLTSVLTLEPVNYYAEKNRYWLCVFYYKEDYSEIIMRFELYENDRKTSATDYYEINKELYSRILLKFGQRI